jgi:hypothetical protein
LTKALAAICDLRGSPNGNVTPASSPVLQPTDERRRSGSHYTPRSLTEPIVRHALEPAFDRLGPDATPDQVLDLKVCDPAMGSGAFLVEACRTLAARLVKAWERWPAARPAIPADEDEDLHARRLVAQRCLYGVDKNPLATDLAKLSLWLATLAREHEFTFLDRHSVERCVSEVMKGRAEIQGAPDDTARIIQEARHRKLEDRINEVRIIGDAVIAAFLGEDRPRARDTRQAEVESWLTASPVVWGRLAAMAATLKQHSNPLTPFHWEIEFPEVFAREQGGFDAIVGNPPFMGGTTISTRLGMGYFRWLSIEYVGARHLCDLVAYFFRRVFSLLRQGGALGLIATNSISQGDTREGGLTPILASGGAVIAAIRRLPWPGAAAVVVSVVHILKGKPTQSPFLDGRRTRRISSYRFQS